MSDALQELKEKKGDLLKDRTGLSREIITNEILNEDIKQGDYKVFSVTRDGLVRFGITSGKLLDREGLNVLNNIAEERGLKLVEDRYGRPVLYKTEEIEEGGFLRSSKVKREKVGRVVKSFIDIDADYGELLEEIGSKVFDASAEPEKEEEKGIEIRYVNKTNRGIKETEDYSSLAICFKNRDRFIDFAKEVNQYLKNELDSGLKVKKSLMKIAKGAKRFQGGTNYEVDLEDYLDVLESTEETFNVLSCNIKGLGAVVDSVTEGISEIYKFEDMQTRLKNIEEEVERHKKEGFDVSLEGSKGRLEDLLDKQRKKAPEVGVELFTTYVTSKPIPISLLEVKNLEKNGRKDRIFDKAFEISESYIGLPVKDEVNSRLRKFKKTYRNTPDLPKHTKISKRLIDVESLARQVS